MLSFWVQKNELQRGNEASQHSLSNRIEKINPTVSLNNKAQYTKKKKKAIYSQCMSKTISHDSSALISISTTTRLFAMRR